MDANDIIAGKPVYHRTNPGRLGVLTGQTLEAMFLMAEVDWGNTFEFVDSSQLIIRDSNVRRDSDSDVKTGRYGTVEDLRRRITFEKLRGLLTDVFYSMKTSEIDFYAHQFKPVLRFIESATNRLLIADEVGLGKTIEAGLIWTEWQARQKARRLLVVCPPTLTAHFGRRIANQTKRISTMEHGGTTHRGLAGFKRQLENLVGERDRQLAKLAQRAETLKETFSEVACGFIDVEPK